jgi:acetylornithine deacetylase
MQIDPTLVSRLRSSLNEDAAIGLLRRFIGTPSVTGAEAAFGQLLADELRSLGADQVTLVDFAPGRPNVRGLLRGQQRGDRPCPRNPEEGVQWNAHLFREAAPPSIQE